RLVDLTGGARVVRLGQTSSSADYAWTMREGESSDMAIETRPTARARPRLENMNLGPGKYARLHRLLYNYGPGHGSLLLLPYDQGLEHGPRASFPTPVSADPDYICRPAIEGGYSGVVFQYGVAARYWPKYAGRLPLVLKLNGKTDIPSDAQALSPLQSSVADAAPLGPHPGAPPD